MGGNANLLAAFRSLGGAIKDIRSTIAIEDANQNAKTLRERFFVLNDPTEDEKTAALHDSKEGNEKLFSLQGERLDRQNQIRGELNEIAANLSAKLTSTGVSAGSIKNLTESLNLPKEEVPKTFFQAIFQGKRQEGSSVLEAGLFAGNEKNKFELAKAAVLSGEKSRLQRIKNAKELKKDFRKSLESKQKEFSTDTKFIEKARSQAVNAITLLDTGNPIAVGAIGTMMAKASGEVGNLTETERQAFRGAQDIWSRLKALVVKNIDSQVPESDIKAIRDLAILYRDSSQKIIEQSADRLSGQLGLAYDRDDFASMRDRIIGKFKLKKSTKETIEDKRLDVIKKSFRKAE